MWHTTEKAGSGDGFMVHTNVPSNRQSVGMGATGAAAAPSRLSSRRSRCSRWLLPVGVVFPQPGQGIHQGNPPVNIAKDGKVVGVWHSWYISREIRFFVLNIK